MDALQVIDLTAQLARQKDFVQKMQEEERVLAAEKQMAYSALEQCRADLYQSRHRIEEMEYLSADLERVVEGKAAALEAAKEVSALEAVTLQAAVHDLSASITSLQVGMY